ncbi:hypothetical protein RUMTOR_00218 [[Ruminococcus] torques ATCC 27756]|uniref:Uncharacterized protein n=1 Tax=[Ruminococcus] torques ATCC 27756 TaxID=411460 RepID=A5KJ21_9FIRM|nr:hypothetical protein RUMTOR_00218 [[Ruminococcus] torques ATCC 27756]
MENRRKDGQKDRQKPTKRLTQVNKTIRILYANYSRNICKIF